MLRHPPVVINKHMGGPPARSQREAQRSRAHGLGSDDDDALNHAFGSRCNVALILIAKMVEFECGPFALHDLVPSYPTTQRGYPPRRHEASRCFAPSSSVHASDAPPLSDFQCRAARHGGRPTARSRPRSRGGFGVRLLPRFFPVCSYSILFLIPFRRSILNLGIARRIAERCFGQGVPRSLPPPHALQVYPSPLLSFSFPYLFTA